MATEITEIELLEALRAALNEEGDHNPHGLTTEEIADAMKCNQRVVRELLRPLVRNGNIAPRRGRRMGIDGTMRPVPIYQLVQEANGDGEAE